VPDQHFARARRLRVFPDTQRARGLSHGKFIEPEDGRLSGGALTDTGEGKQAATPIRAYTSKNQAEKHAFDLQRDPFGDQYYTWVAIEVWDRYDQKDQNDLSTSSL
jgi:hypothetical protein